MDHHLTPPDPDLFYTRNDPNDPRLGERVSAAYAASDVVLLGLPQDEGVRRNKGRPGSAAAPDAIRQRLYRLVPPSHTTLYDLGNTRTDGTLEDIHARHRAVVRQILADGKRLIVLGGGNDTSYPDCAALSDVFPDPAAFNVDAHFDVRADQQPNSGTPYRQLLEGGHLSPRRFYEMAHQPFANAATYHTYLEQQGVHVHSLEALRDGGVVPTFRDALADITAKAIFWGIDMDSVRASDAPGVSAPSPIGLTAEDLIAIVRLAARDPRSRLLEITEVNPRHDIDGRTSRLAAICVWHFLNAS